MIPAVLALVSYSAGSRLSGSGRYYAQISLPVRDPRFAAAHAGPVGVPSRHARRSDGLREWRSETVFR